MREAIGSRELSVALLIFGAFISVYMVLLTVPTSAQNAGGSGLPTGTPARGENTDNPSAPPNLVTISAAACTVADTGASVTLEDGDGTQARFVEGPDVEITATESQIRIEALNRKFLIDVAEFLDASDQSFDTDGNYTVVTSTDIVCAGGSSGGTTGGAQGTSVPGSTSGVILTTIPQKPLPPTGGFPSAYIVIVGFIITGLLALGIGVRRGQQGR